MLFSYNLLQEHITGKLPSPKKLEHLLNMHIFAVEGREQKKGDWIFDVSVLARRGDAVGHYGLAREIAALLGRQLKEPSGKPLKKEKGILPLLQVKIQAPAVYRYSALVLQGVRIEKSPQWLRDRLELLGINSINNAVDITNYIMAELGQPLHAFDYDRIQGGTMLLRAAREGEKIETLDNLTFKLPKGTLVIQDKSRLIDLAGMKGGKWSAVQKNTKNIVLQAAVFSGKHIYKTKKQLGYTTPAANVYTHELDPNCTIGALERAHELLGGAAKAVQVIDMYPQKRVARKVMFDPALLERYLGASIPKAATKQILQRLGFRVKEQKKGLEITIPTFRQDVVLPVDIVEEVGRVYGYEKIAPVFPIGPLSPSIENPRIRFKERLQDSLVQAGYTETYNYSFIGEKDLEIFSYTPKDKEALVGLQNPYSEEYKYLRSNLLENLLKVAEENVKTVRRKEIRVFEMGKAFLQSKGKVDEWDLASGVLLLSQKDEQTAFAEIKGVVDLLLNNLGVGTPWYDAYKPTPLRKRTSLWHAQKIAEVKAGTNKVGFLGIISPQITTNLKLKGSVAAFSLDIATLLPLIAIEKQYQPIPRFPAAYRDLAVLVPRGTKVAELMNVMHTAGSELLDDIDLFDLYEGEAIPEEKKNFAFHLIYQSRERTLIAKEVDALHQKIITALEKNPEWEVRK